ncbi:c-type cytochrome [Zavarzinia compransoris]|uniref:Cytochrome c family protein n=1 Tax=Zavarzinia compransoris TaxID=1264899 RepID=A0A317E7G6_9PROT|nr:cytochrome c family protein [Zavarzinia compransoris]PWR22220.1 cytochrome c family protein [Zavarzinia compransoris]TDP47026.1 cytochrome c [Zavarzinia compransoris]
MSARIAFAGTFFAALALVAPAEAQELAAPDLAAGEKAFKKCMSCHSVKADENKVGPHLFGIVDRPVASVGGFKYSDAMKAKGGAWTREELDAYLTNPRQALPGTNMSFMGLKKPEERAALIDYLAAQK